MKKHQFVKVFFNRLYHAGVIDAIQPLWNLLKRSVNPFTSYSDPESGTPDGKVEKVIVKI